MDTLNMPISLSCFGLGRKREYPEITPSPHIQANSAHTGLNGTFNPGGVRRTCSRLSQRAPLNTLMLCLKPQTCVLF